MRTVIAAVLLVLIIAIGIFEQVHIKKIYEELNLRTVRIINTIEDEDINLAVDYTDNTIEWWDKKLEILELMVPHIILRDVSLQLHDIKGQLEGEDIGQAIGACYVLIGLCESTPHILGFRLQHIF